MSGQLSAASVYVSFRRRVRRQNEINSGFEAESYAKREIAALFRALQLSRDHCPHIFARQQHLSRNRARPASLEGAQHLQQNKNAARRRAARPPNKGRGSRNKRPRAPGSTQSRRNLLSKRRKRPLRGRRRAMHVRRAAAVLRSTGGRPSGAHGWEGRRRALAHCA